MCFQQVIKLLAKCQPAILIFVTEVVELMQCSFVLKYNLVSPAEGHHVWSNKVSVFGENRTESE